ncbi:hypothetical protein K7X08_028444 [Anisodus acutangulus]|uniref:Uncharacterized protein n=1 Tax=Anisodus acutangulus TaxID=402998 RepID=A0A9Q1M8E7_9SOLA|nr:hypothetical protein K7X08_028444 [Anisodus acutangulus]
MAVLEDPLFKKKNISEHNAWTVEFSGPSILFQSHLLQKIGEWHQEKTTKKKKKKKKTMMQTTKGGKKKMRMKLNQT